MGQSPSARENIEPNLVVSSRLDDIEPNLVVSPRLDDIASSPRLGDLDSPRGPAGFALITISTKLVPPTSMPNLNRGNFQVQIHRVARRGMQPHITNFSRGRATLKSALISINFTALEGSQSHPLYFDEGDSQISSGIQPKISEESQISSPTQLVAMLPTGSYTLDTIAQTIGRCMTQASSKGTYTGIYDYNDCKFVLSGSVQFRLLGSNDLIEGSKIVSKQIKTTLHALGFKNYSTSYSQIHSSHCPIMPSHPKELRLYVKEFGKRRQILADSQDKCSSPETLDNIKSDNSYTFAIPCRPDPRGHIVYSSEDKDNIVGYDSRQAWVNVQLLDETGQQVNIQQDWSCAVLLEAV